MKWIYRIIQKVKVAAALGVVFVLVFATNMMDKSNFSELQDSFSTVYEDRLIVESYIYEISGYVHKKKLNFEHQNESNIEGLKEKNIALNDSIDYLLGEFGKTKLTQLESQWFVKLKKNLSQLYIDEQNYSVNNSEKERTALRHSIEQQHTAIAKDLDELSAIQLDEARLVIDNTKKIIASSNLASHIEICVLLVIGLIVQGLLLASGSIRTRFPQKSSLN